MVFNNILGKFSKDLGIDLGTANTLVYVKDRGIVINEPSVVALNNNTDQILAVGQQAKRMIGKTPPHITTSRPLHQGVVSDFEVTEKMLKYFIDKVHRETFTILPRPRIVIAIPMGVTEVEKKAVEDAAMNAGARKVYLIEEPMAAAIGARLPIQDSTGNMVVDIGGGSTEIAVISLGGIVTWRSLRVAGDELNQNIINYCREEFNFLLGEHTAEELKIKMSSATKEDNLEAKVKGRDMNTGLPREVVINSEHVNEAISKTVSLFIDNIKSTLEETPPELVSDIYERGIILSGGGAMLRGLDKKIAQATNIPVRAADDPLTTVARGTGFILEDLENLKDLFVLSTADDRIEI